MRRARRIASPFVCPFLLFLITGCATGNRLVITGEPARPEAAAKVPAGDAPVAVLDFEYAALEPGVVGRDFDHVRPIVWEGKPGKVMADLVAGVLAGHGVRAVRAAAEGPALDNVPVRVSGRVRRFEVNARRSGTVNVFTEATVTLAVAAAGGAPARKSA